MLTSNTIHATIHQRQMPYEITHMWNLNYDRNESTYKIETDS